MVQRLRHSPGQYWSHVAKFGISPMASSTPAPCPPKGQALLEAMRRHLFSSQAKSASLATTHDHYVCLALAVRDILLTSWVDTVDTYTSQHVRTATYMSAEYLLGPHL